LNFLARKCSLIFHYELNCLKTIVPSLLLSYNFFRSSTSSVTTNHVIIAVSTHGRKLRPLNIQIVLQTSCLSLKIIQRRILTETSPRLRELRLKIRHKLGEKSRNERSGQSQRAMSQCQLGVDYYASHLSRHGFAVVEQKMLLLLAVFALDFSHPSAVHIVQHDFRLGALPEAEETLQNNAQYRWLHSKTVSEWMRDNG
jgi:hypothetical protein